MMKKLLLPVLMASVANATDFRVAPTGVDVLHKAIETARKTPGSNTILLAAGRYFNTGGIVLDARDSALTIRGEPGAEVYGGLPVTGWEKWKGDIWRAPVPKGFRFFNLVVDGRPATMAQTPNAGSGFGGGARTINNSAVEVPAAWRGYDYSDAQVFAFIGGNWFSEMRAVLAESPDAQGVLPVDSGSGQFGGMNDRIFLRGVLDFLDEPGEWCLKHQEGFLYYWPESGEPADHVIVRPTGQRLFEVNGASGVTIENLALIGSDFCERWYLFGPNQDGSTPTPLQQGLVFGENVERLTVRNCRILAAGHSGVWLNHRAQDCVVENCLIQGAGFAGIYANGFMPGEGPFTNAAESYVNKGHRIENNFIYDCGKNVGGGCGIQFYQSGDSLITRNEIGQMPRYGISYKGIRWGIIPKKLYGHDLTFDSHFDYLHTRNLKITGNEIYSVCRNSFDFGGIEAWSPGRDNLWANNALHDIDQTLDWNGWAHVLFADDATHWLTMSDNIIHHCHGGGATGAFMMKSLNQVIENNLVVDCTLGRVVSLNAYIEPGGNFTIRRNIFATDGSYTRYAEQPEVFTGYAGTAEILPPGVGGIMAINHNVITPHDPANPNPLAGKGVDTDSFFGDAGILRAKPDWDITFRDYALAPDSPAFQVGFLPIDVSVIGLKADFPFDKLAATRRQATDKIQAEDYQRMRNLRTEAGRGLYSIEPGAWAKYANIEFPTGLTRAVFALTTPEPSPGEQTFIRRYGDTEVAATPFVGGADTIIGQWEVSESYTASGKTGKELLDLPFPPEQDMEAGAWKPWLGPVTSRRGETTPPGVTDLYLANGEKDTDACAYLRASIHVPSTSNNQNTTAFTMECASGVKLWVNGELALSMDTAETRKTSRNVAMKDGWNTVLVKVAQGGGPDGSFRAKVSTASSFWPIAVYLPGLPTMERGRPTDVGTLVELRIDSPQGPLIGRLAAGQTECTIAGPSGIHNLYLVFPGGGVKELDHFRMN
jgi:Right handed beta helix region